jgi:peptidoglycan/xylan/chitin deacetylase (PgdA/CDA1 family)
MIHQLKRLKTLFKKKAIVLMYHRIADVDIDPWQLSVSPGNFEAQIAFLKSYYNVISLTDLVSQLYEKKLKKDAVCITFDDGYADNYYQALPILKKYNCPATFFIAGSYIDSRMLFWWDELEEIFLGSRKLPAELSLVIDGTAHSFSNKELTLTDAKMHLHQNWQWPDAAPTGRCELYLEIWEKLLPLKIDSIQPVLKDLREWAGGTKPTDHNKIPMTTKHLQEIDANELFSLGNHTYSHPALPFHSDLHQREEMMQCYDYLSSNYKHVVNYLAYPYGRFNRDTLNVASKNDIKAAFTTTSKVVLDDDDVFQLGRVQVNNWNADQLKSKLRFYIN